MLPLVMAGIGAVGGLAQSIIGGIQAKKARKQLEKLQTPTYSASKSITDYYNEAKSRYEENPYQSNLYKMQAQNIQRGTAQGISGLQDRRSALAGISGLIQNQNDALLKAGVAAEQQKDQRFGQYGAASGAMAAEQRKEWEVNQLMPYQKRYDILMQKASGGAQMMNAGIQNMFGGIQTGVLAKSGLMGNQPQSMPDYSSYEYGNPQPSTYKVPRASY